MKELYRECPFQNIAESPRDEDPKDARDNQCRKQRDEAVAEAE